MRRGILSTLLIGAAVGAVTLAQRPVVAVPATGGTFVGSDTCVSCHDDRDIVRGTSPHASGAFMELGVHGCETCHGPGSLHVDDPEDEALQPSLERLSTADQNAVCSGCHDGRDQFFWPGSAHASRGLSCMTCHSIHDPLSLDGQLKTATEVDTCVTCHTNVRAEMWKTSHHPIREGQISCSDCHNPHGTQTEGMVRAASINDQCYECHTEKRGPFLWEHAPVRESCLTCHTPHGSNHTSLQKTSIPFLCQQCHANIRHPGTLFDARQRPVGPSPSNRLFNRACLNCHPAIHGSNHPSSPYLAH